MNLPIWPMRRVLVFGATSAIAHATQRLLLQAGCEIYAVGRDPARLDAVLRDLRVRAGPGRVVDGCCADLDTLDGHAALFERAQRALGGIDVVLIAHGSLPGQAACDASVEQALRALHTNGTSAAALALRAAQRLEQQGHGMLVGIGAAAGESGRRSNYLYAAAKNQFETVLQGLRERLAARGVHVLCVEPGWVDTPLTAAFTPKGSLWTSPQRVAGGIVAAMRARRDVACLPGSRRWQALAMRWIGGRRLPRMPR